jgi:hypothetical protein
VEEVEEVEEVKEVKEIKEEIAADFIEGKDRRMT